LDELMGLLNFMRKLILLFMLFFKVLKLKLQL